MGVPVVIDSDDVESLLFVTSAIKGIESAIEASKKDVFGAAPRARFTGAHERIAAAWRTANRQKQTPERFEPATPSEIKQLRNLFRKDERVPPLGLPAPIPSTMYTDILRPLMANGFVELGAYREMVVWGSSGDITSQDHPHVQRYRLTTRGREAMEPHKK